MSLPRWHFGTRLRCIYSYMPCDKPLLKEFTITFIIIVSHLLKLNFYRKIVFPIGNQYSYRKVPIGIQELPTGISIPLGFDKVREENSYRKTTCLNLIRTGISLNSPIGNIICIAFLEYLLGLSIFPATESF